MSFDWWRHDTDEGISVHEIRERIMQEQRASGRIHAAPRTPPTVAQAHRITQQHRGCSLSDCPRKRAAWQVLVEAGRVKPDSGRAYEPPMP